MGSYVIQKQNHPTHPVENTGNQENSVNSSEFYLGDFFIQPELLRITSINEMSTTVEPKVMDVLLCLANRQGHVVSRDDLMSTVWPDVFIVDDTLTRCISQLRKIFEDVATDSKVIQTIRKRGYRLMLPIERERKNFVADVRVRRSFTRVRQATFAALMICAIFGYGWLSARNDSVGELSLSTANTEARAIFIDSTESVFELPSTFGTLTLVGEPVSDLEASLLVGSMTGDSSFVWHPIELGSTN